MNRLGKTPDSVPAASRELLEWIGTVSPSGQPFPLHRQMAISPSTLAGYVALRQAADNVSISPRLGYLIMAAASAPLATKASSFAQETMTMLAEKVGWTAEEIGAVNHGEHLGDERNDAIVDLAREAAAHSGAVRTSTWDKALSAGWSKGELADAFALIINAAFTAFFCNYVEFSPASDGD